MGNCFSEACEVDLDPAERAQKSELYIACEKHVPGWTGVAASALVIKKSKIGYKVSMIDKESCSATKPSQVLCTFGDESGNDIGAQAAKVYQDISGEVYLEPGPDNNGLRITAFPAGERTNTGGGNPFDATEDATEYGRILGQVHKTDDAWLQSFETDGTYESARLKELLAILPEAQKAEIQVAAKKDKYGTMILFILALFRASGQDIKRVMQDMKGTPANLTQSSNIVAFAPLTDEEVQEAQKWFNDAAALLPDILAFDRLGNNFMDRVVVNHGDAHGANVYHRKADKTGGLMLVDFEHSILRAPAWMDFGAIPVQWLTEGYLTGKKYPSLESRRAAAKAYREQFTTEELGQFSRTTDDEIVFDAYKGVVARLVMMSFVMTVTCGLRQKYGSDRALAYSSWSYLVAAQRCAAMLKEAETDADLKSKLLQEGLLPEVMRDPDFQITSPGFFQSSVELDNASRDIKLGPISGEAAGCTVM